MRRTAAFLLLLTAGCSTAPIADLLDWCKPGKLDPASGPFYGGVGQPLAVPLPGPSVMPAPTMELPPPPPGATPVPVPPAPPGMSR